MIISVDFDGSLCLGQEFDIELKTLNQKLKDQINYLHQNGNYIKIVTARGAFNSTIEARKQKYLVPITSWLSNNNVEYDEVSFNKEFADIYIDDLAIRPNEISIVKDLSSGFTRNVVTRINGIVIKTGATITDEVAWYNAFKDKQFVPEVINVTRNSVVYVYTEIVGNVNLEKVIELTDIYKKYTPLNILPFSSYIANIRRHLCTNPEFGSSVMGLITALEYLDVRPTFAHGDLSIENIIPTVDSVKLIDPLYSEHRFGSITTDFAKLLLSLKFYRGNVTAFNHLKTWVAIPGIDVLIAAEAVRVASYKKSFSFIAENLINEL